MGSPTAVHCGSQSTNLLIINAVTTGAIIEFVIVNSYYPLNLLNLLIDDIACLVRTVGIHADGKWVQFLGDDPQTQSRSSQPPCMVPGFNLETMMISLLFTENLGQI